MSAASPVSTSSFPPQVNDGILHADIEKQAPCAAPLLHLKGEEMDGGRICTGRPAFLSLAESWIYYGKQLAGLSFGRDPINYASTPYIPQVAQASHETNAYYSTSLRLCCFEPALTRSPALTLEMASHAWHPRFRQTSQPALANP